MSRARRILLALLLGVAVVEALWAWPWSRDLVVQIIPRPQQYLIFPPPGSIPLGWEAPLTREAAATRLRNPLAPPPGQAPSPQAAEQGKKLYETYCIVCHGPQGRGNGPVAGGALLPADLTSDRVQTQPDGALYATVRNGFSTMPAYGERLTPQERWQVILYVRALAAKEAR